MEAAAFLLISVKICRVEYGCKYFLRKVYNDCGATSQKIEIFIVSTVKTSKHISLLNGKLQNYLIILAWEFL
jgi:hypothetical protein